MRAKDKKPKYINLIKKMAHKVGAKVLIEPEWENAGQIIYKNGIVRSFFRHLLDLNGMGAAEIAGDKEYAKFFMKKKGYLVAKGISIFRDSWARTVGSNRTLSFAVDYANTVGYPLIVKPNSKSQGVDVYLVFNKKELTTGLKQIFKKDRVAIMEEYLSGKDYRVTVLDKEVISAYQSIPLSVVGDGEHSLGWLLKQKINLLRKKEIKINIKDKRIELKLRQTGLTFETILPKDKKAFLLSNANLSAGGDAIDFSGTIHPGFRKISMNLIKDMGLRLAGVDIMVTKGDITKNPKDCEYYIIEINSAPGIEPTEEKYLKILKALARQ